MDTKDKNNILENGVDDNSNIINASSDVCLCPVVEDGLETSGRVDESGLDESQLDFSYSPTGYTTSELDTTDMTGLETTTDISGLETTTDDVSGLDTTTDINEFETTTESMFTIDKTGFTEVDTSSATCHKSDTETADEAGDTDAVVGLTETEDIDRGDEAQMSHTETADEAGDTDAVVGLTETEDIDRGDEAQMSHTETADEAGDTDAVVGLTDTEDIDRVDEAQMSHTETADEAGDTDAVVGLTETEVTDRGDEAQMSQTDSADKAGDTDAGVGLTETEDVDRGDKAQITQTETDLVAFSKQYVENLIESVATAKLDDNEAEDNEQKNEANLGIEQEVVVAVEEKDQPGKDIEADLPPEYCKESETAIEVKIETDNSPEKEIKIKSEIENEDDLLENKMNEEHVELVAEKDSALENVSNMESETELKLDQTGFKEERETEDILNSEKEGKQDKFDPTKETLEGDYQIDKDDKVEISSKVEQFEVENDEIFLSDDETADYVDSSLTNVTAMTHPSLSDTTFQNMSDGNILNEDAERMFRNVTETKRDSIGIRDAETTDNVDSSLTNVTAMTHPSFSDSSFQNMSDGNILMNEHGERIFRNVTEPRKDSIGLCESCGSDMSSFLDTTGCSSEFSFYVCYDCQQSKESMPDTEPDVVEVEDVEKNAEVFEVAPDAEDHLNRVQIDNLWQGVVAEKPLDLKLNRQVDQEDAIDLDADISVERPVELSQDDESDKEFTLLQKQKEEEDMLGQYSTIVLTPLKTEAVLSKQIVESEDENVAEPEQLQVAFTDKLEDEKYELHVGQNLAPAIESVCVKDNVNTNEEITDINKDSVKSLIESHPIDSMDENESLPMTDIAPSEVKPEFELDGAVGGQMTDSMVSDAILDEVSSLLSELQDMVCESRIDIEASANMEELEVLDSLTKFSIDDMKPECSTDDYPTKTEAYETTISDEPRLDITIEGIQIYLLYA